MFRKMNFTTKVILGVIVVVGLTVIAMQSMQRHQTVTLMLEVDGNTVEAQELDVTTWRWNRSLQNGDRVDLVYNKLINEFHTEDARSHSYAFSKAWEVTYSGIVALN